MVYEGIIGILADDKESFPVIQTSPLKIRKRIK